MKKEFILEMRNSGRFIGMPVKAKFDDERLTSNKSVSCEVFLSDTEGLELQKGDKIKVTIEKEEDVELEVTAEVVDDEDS